MNGPVARAGSMSYLSKIKGINVPITAANTMTTNKEELTTTPNSIVPKNHAIPKISDEQIKPLNSPTKTSLPSFEKILLN